MKRSRKILSSYTVARYCSDIADVAYRIEEIREKITERNRTSKKIPLYFYNRLSKLKNKLNKLTNKQQ